MKMPWHRPIESLVERAVLARTPEIARQAVEAIHARLKEESRIEAAQEIVRAMTGFQNQVPSGYPQTGDSPHPLYGFDNPWRWSVPISPKQRPDSFINIDTMRRFANTYDILRACINHLKREIQAQQFSIKAKDPLNKSKATASDIADAYEFFSMEGGLGECNETRRIYEAKLVEDVMVVGAYASWKSRSRSGKLLQVLNIDAATIRPCMDRFGWPGPTEDWYQQWIQGCLITGFTPDEMTYTGLWPETCSPYFRSAVEYLITTTLSALKADEWNRTWLTDGNTPGRAIGLPESWQPPQIREYAELMMDMLVGDSAKRQQVLFLPGGAKEVLSHSRKDQDFSEFEMWLARRTGAVTGVQLASIGFAGDQYKNTEEGSLHTTSQFGAGALLDLRKEHYDDILSNLGYGHLETHNGETAEEAPLERAQRLFIEANWTSIDELRAETGRDPIEGGENILVSSLLVPLDRALEPPISAVAEPGAEPEIKEIPKSSKEDDEDLNRWMRKSLNRLKGGKPALCTFSSTLINRAKAARIARALGQCESSQDIKAVFRVETDDDDSEDDTPDKKKGVRLLLVVVDDIASELTNGSKSLIDGSMTVRQFVDSAVESLVPMHTRAATYGRARATGSGPSTLPTSADAVIGRRVAESQRPYLENLAQDILQGNASDAQLLNRLQQYGQRAVGTANEVWVANQPETETIDWIDTGDNAECENCVSRAANGPYTSETLPSVPGDGSTLCQMRCRCYLETSGGERSFYDPLDEMP